MACAFGPDGAELFEGGVELGGHSRLSLRASSGNNSRDHEYGEWSVRHFRLEKKARGLSNDAAAASWIQ
jgi:hypothetical protein